MKLKLGFFSFLLLFSSLSLAGDITGTVYIAKEKSKTPLSRVPLRLHVYKDDYEFSGIETMTDAFGKFRFRDLQTDDRYSYIFYPIYQGINYPYEEGSFPKNSNTIKQDFVITESTGSTKDIIANESIFFDFGQKDIWKVTHVINLENKGELLYHPDRPDSQPLTFSLFEGGFDLAYLDGVSRGNSKIDDEKDTLQVFSPIPAHETSTFKFSYYYIPSKRIVGFNRDAFLARSNINLFFNKKATVISNQFQSDPMMAKTQPGYIRAFTSGPIAQNEKISFEIKGFFLRSDILHLAVLALCLSFAVLMIIVTFGFQKSEKSRDKELTERMHRYLIDLRKQRKEGTIDKHLFEKEEQRVRNFLFQVSKSDES